MTYTAGQVITDDDYNIFATGNAAGTGDHAVANVNTVWGTGDGVDKGWGQSGNLSSVSAGSTITATQWADLLNRISTIASHQGTSITAITNPSTGNTIEAYTALQGNVTDIFNNRLDSAAVQSSLNLTTSRTADWKVAVTMEQTVTFSTADDMRTFFNAGGYISIDSERSGGTASDKNTGWTDLLSATAVVALSSDGASKTIAGSTHTGTTKFGGSGTPDILLTGTGYHQLTTSDVNIFRQYDISANYTSNYVTIAVNANANVLTITTTYTDAAADEVTSPGEELDIVDGTLSTFLKVYQPSTTHITNTWGTPVLDGSESGS